ncbi:MAG: hypothetical protein O8C61_09645 [Candidatus Methanoperedens sp.]|nr:hypothetical protein [Candidatus Methanoperedens sp.]
MMKLSRSKYNKIDAISKLTGLILLAVSIDNVAKGNYYIALFFFGLGGIIGILPIFIKFET